MPVVEELIRKEEDGTLSFGNYLLNTKAKLDNYEFKGDFYKVKTYEQITKLECNGTFVYESVPGTSVNNLKLTESGMCFTVEGKEDAQITIELDEGVDYKVYLNDEEAGIMKTNLGGKLSVGVEFVNGEAVKVRVEKA
ncbi:hypothetical protein SAMN05216249_11321 [Acetitomaculum ruminis DSM 5522]|uniref:Endosialidase n=1 Tax=Acetitomaculum ruminis DSM 5522 TaxID=1120918 RepID=A0A1I0Z4X4_9FIRM|nr:endosialidase [Acetitomaculum ruminis]SFB20611.1 hypothetical protein SAMN05216249_11321 [Acetitomaculum ruminis DSM 5522]